MLLLQRSGLFSEGNMVKGRQVVKKALVASSCDCGPQRQLNAVQPKHGHGSEQGSKGVAEEQG